ncbi:YfjI family protein [Variovorax sp. LT1P1]|uniref:YfjI family protein n=1 Tax=Variovorax sp. LT1P1 TaxID=3443730 RepID=UPI003F477EE5
MIAPTVAPPYPIGAFPPNLASVALEIQTKVQAPDALVGMVFLSAISLACQALIDVRLPTGQVRPVSANCVCIAESGERKTAIEGIVCAPIHIHDEARAVKYKDDLAQYMCDMKVWKAKDQVLNGKLKKAAHQDESTEEIQEQWEAHEKTMPIKPRLRQFIRQDISARALMDVLEGECESIALLSDEGEAVLKGSAMATFSVHNRAWDGAKMLTLDRGNNAHVVARNPRSLMSIMVQPVVLKNYQRRHGELARGSGFWARVLVGFPTSTQGFRFVYWYNEQWTHLHGFHTRIKELLEEYDLRHAQGPIKREVLEFSPEAVPRWIELANHVEGMLQPFGYLSDIKDFASKAMEMTGRIAALLHFFNEQEGQISLAELQCAFSIMCWHIDEFKRLFGDQTEPTQLQSDAKALEFYLHTRFYQTGNLTAPRNFVLRTGPIRPVARFNEVLDYLVACGKVWIGQVGRRRFINPGPKFGMP